MNVVLRIAYDGSRFVGWQKTNLDPHRFPSIEYELERALERIVQHKVQLEAASRTDRGVHAEGQCVSFLLHKPHCDLQALIYSLNALLPKDIRVLDAESIGDPSFHVTLSARSKEYHYRIAYGRTLLPLLRHTHWHFPYPLDTAKMSQAARAFIGTHDFASFRNRRKDQDPEDTIRELYAIDILQERHDTLLICMHGANFLYKMARNIAGTLAYIGAGKMSEDSVEKLLLTRSRVDAAMTAPSHGLVLHKVFY